MPKVAVITGAGAGVGRATVEEFARQGFDVALLSREPARLEGRPRKRARRACARCRFRPMSPTRPPWRPPPNGPRLSSGRSTCG